MVSARSDVSVGPTACASAMGTTLYGPLTMTLRGTPVLRREDDPLLRGAGTYVANIDLTGAAVVAYVTSPVAHARITGIDTSEALATPGVVDVVTAADLDGLGGYPLGNPMFNKAMARPLLATDTVRFVGEPIVAVVAETETIAIDAAESIVVDFDDLPAVVSMDEAVATDIRLKNAVKEGSVLSEALAVVGCEDHVGALAKPRGIERAHQVPDLLVDPLDFREV